MCKITIISRKAKEKAVFSYGCTNQEGWKPGVIPPSWNVPDGW